MLRPLLSSLLLLVAVGTGRADTTAGDWDTIVIPPTKTSIYVGSVTLTTTEFRREGDRFFSTYEAKVRPWFFWSESGRISIIVPAADLEKLARGERIEFTGEAFNEKNKPRRVTGRADRTDGASGKIKVRITVDGIELVFNGEYRLPNTYK